MTNRIFSVLIKLREDNTWLQCHQKQPTWVLYSDLDERWFLFSVHLQVWSIREMVTLPGEPVKFNYAKILHEFQSYSCGSPLEQFGQHFTDRVSEYSLRSKSSDVIKLLKEANSVSHAEAWFTNNNKLSVTYSCKLSKSIAMLFFTTRGALDDFGAEWFWWWTKVKSGAKREWFLFIPLFLREREIDVCKNFLRASEIFFVLLL